MNSIFTKKTKIENDTIDNIASLSHTKWNCRDYRKSCVNLTEMRIPVMYNGERIGTRELLKKILYA